MPYTVEWKNKGYYVSYFGVLTTDEVMQANLSMEADERFDDLRYSISNYLDVDSLKFDMESIEHMIRKSVKINAAASLSNPFIKRAIVATDETVLAFVNLYIAESKSEKSTWELRVFSNLNEAESWVQR